MQLATPARYAEMLDAAKAGGYAIAAVDVSSSTTLNAAMLSFARAGSDRIVQVSRRTRSPRQSATGSSR